VHLLDCGGEVVGVVVVKIADIVVL